MGRVPSRTPAWRNSAGSLLPNTKQGDWRRPTARPPGVRSDLLPSAPGILATTRWGKAPAPPVRRAKDTVPAPERRRARAGGACVRHLETTATRGVAPRPPRQPHRLVGLATRHRGPPRLRGRPRRGGRTVRPEVAGSRRRGGAPAGRRTSASGDYYRPSSGPLISAPQPFQAPRTASPGMPRT